MQRDMAVPTLRTPSPGGATGCPRAHRLSPSPPAVPKPSAAPLTSDTPAGHSGQRCHQRRGDIAVPTLPRVPPHRCHAWSCSCTPTPSPPDPSPAPTSLPAPRGPGGPGLSCRCPRGRGGSPAAGPAPRPLLSAHNKGILQTSLPSHLTAALATPPLSRCPSAPIPAVSPPAPLSPACTPSLTGSPQCPQHVPRARATFPHPGPHSVTPSVPRPRCVPSPDPSRSCHIPAGVTVPILHSPAAVTVPVPIPAGVTVPIPIPAGVTVPVPAGVTVPIPAGVTVPVPIPIPIPAGVTVPVPAAGPPTPAFPTRLHPAPAVVAPVSLPVSPPPSPSPQHCRCHRPHRRHRAPHSCSPRSPAASPARIRLGSCRGAAGTGVGVAVTVPIPAPSADPSRSCRSRAGVTVPTAGPQRGRCRCRCRCRCRTYLLRAQGAPGLIAAGRAEQPRRHRGLKAALGAGAAGRAPPGGGRAGPGRANRGWRRAGPPRRCRRMDPWKPESKVLISDSIVPDFRWRFLPFVSPPCSGTIPALPAHRAPLFPSFMRLQLAGPARGGIDGLTPRSLWAQRVPRVTHPKKLPHSCSQPDPGPREGPGASRGPRGTRGAAAGGWGAVTAPRGARCEGQGPAGTPRLLRPRAGGSPLLECPQTPRGQRGADFGDTSDRSLDRAKPGGRRGRERPEPLRFGLLAPRRPGASPGTERPRSAARCPRTAAGGSGGPRAEPPEPLVIPLSSAGG
ncbi:nascent polypeptide-associated complex subunit alpha, muscle-specific form-like [Zonotrichia leucophrys gambelii]|uniref:nascent polypeptide-associated complex subunit alpha, muscle-specific form-like n=1 Tax=Zonotrichia leucophrys gambelii TaxID=257770 RepID=UPI0031409F58